jgi:hypothetical protein
MGPFRERIPTFKGIMTTLGYETRRMAIKRMKLESTSTASWLIDQPLFCFLVITFASTFMKCVTLFSGETGCAFFDRNARPRWHSVKNALTTENKKKQFLYIKSFDLTKPEHRTISTTGAKALCKLLTDTKLKGMYSVAVYIPDARSQFAQQDRD